MSPKIRWRAIEESPDVDLCLYTHGLVHCTHIHTQAQTCTSCTHTYMHIHIGKVKQKLLQQCFLGSSICKNDLNHLIKQRWMKPSSEWRSRTGESRKSPGHVCNHHTVCYDLKEKDVLKHGLGWVTPESLVLVLLLILFCFNISWDVCIRGSCVRTFNLLNIFCWKIASKIYKKLNIFHSIPDFSLYCQQLFQILVGSRNIFFLPMSV